MPGSSLPLRFVRSAASCPPAPSIASAMRRKRRPPIRVGLKLVNVAVTNCTLYFKAFYRYLSPKFEGSITSDLAPGAQPPQSLSLASLNCFLSIKRGTARQHESVDLTRHLLNSPLRPHAVRQLVNAINGTRIQLCTFGLLRWVLC